MFGTMLGLLTLGATIAALIYCMPRGGKTHWLIGTEWEPYLGVVFCSGLVLGVMMIVWGLVAALA